MTSLASIQALPDDLAHVLPEADVWPDAVRRRHGGPGALSPDGRRLWLPLPGADSPDFQTGIAWAVAEALVEDGVAGRVDINVPLGGVVVEAANGRLDVERTHHVCATVTSSWSRAHDVVATAPARVTPGDGARVRERGTSLATDLAGAVLSRLVPKRRRAPSVVPAVTQLVSTNAAARASVQRVLGPVLGDGVVDTLHAAAQSAAGHTGSVLLDAASQAVGLRAATAAERAWARQEPVLARGAADTDPRPPGAPIRSRGAADRYSDAAAGTGVAAAVAAALKGRPDLSARSVLASSPKAVHYSAEAFVSETSRSLCEVHDAVLIDSTGLAALGSVSAVVIDPSCLVTDDVRVGDVLASTADARAAVWELAEASAGAGAEPGWHPAATLPGAQRLPRAAATARALLVRSPRPLADELLTLLRHLPVRTVMPDAAWLGDLRASVDELCQGDGDAALVAEVARLQAAGHVVAVVAGATARGALASADLGVGILAQGEAPDSRVQVPWTADVVVPDLSCAWSLLSRLSSARRAATTSAAVAAGASVLEAITIVAPPRFALPVGPVLAGGVLGLAHGWRSAIKAARVAPPEGVVRLPWHALPVAEVLSLLPDPGLDPRRDGDDATTSEPVLKRFWRAFADDLDDPLTSVLATGAASSAVLGSPGDAALVAGVLLGNAALSSVQRVRAESLLARLLQASAATARILPRSSSSARGDTDAGAVRDVPPVRLRPGMVIEVLAGQVVPADARVVDARAAEVDESSLTGESLPVRKDPLPTPGAPLAERTSMVYEGTVLLTGRVVAVVTAVGDATEAGRAVSLIGAAARRRGAQAQLSHLTEATLPLTFAGGASVIGLGLLAGGAVREAVESGVSVSVAAVPEGLPLVATLAQNASAHRLAGADVLVRDATAIEALGRVDTVCFDKTGTLTKNRLSVQVVEPVAGTSADELLRAAAVTTPRPREDEPELQATDRAVADAWGAQHPGQDDFLPFRSGRPFAAAALDGRLYVKGAPEIVVAACAGRSTAEDQHLADVLGRLADDGLRVLAVATRALPPRGAALDESGLEHLATGGLTLLGVLGISDELRDGVPELMDGLAYRRIRPVIVTGDHPRTAMAIARAAGLDPRPQDVVTGSEWAGMSRRARADAVRTTTVFARTSPQQKTEIVAALGEAGATAAMVGDGANDAAAIRAACVGIGVASHGSDPARGAADVVIDGAAMARVLDALDEGSMLWKRVHAAMGVLLGGNFGEVAFTALGVAASGRSPLTSRQLLLVNLLTDAAPAAALAVSPIRSNPQDRPGLDEEHLWRTVVSRGATTTLGATTAWAAARLTLGSPRRASTVGLVGLVATQLAQTVVDSPSRRVAATALGSLGALGVAVGTPGISQSMGCTPLGPLGWAQGLGAAGAATLLGMLNPLVERGALEARPTVARIPDDDRTEPAATAEEER